MSIPLSDSVRGVMEAAEREARAMGHEYVGTEHLLLALSADGSDVTGHVLAGMGLNAEAVRGEIERQIGPVATLPTDRASAPLPWTPRLRHALDCAGREAWVMGRREVGAEHLLLGLLHEPEGVAGLVLRGRGMAVEKVREQVLAASVLMMKVVERAVRPLHASVATKRRIREELLAHLTAIHEEELRERKDPAAAVDAAIERFGSPGSLSMELARSLPVNERIAHWIERWVGWRAPESAARYVTRLAALTFCLLAAAFAVGASLLLGAYGPDVGVLRSTRAFGAVVIFTPLAQWVLGILYYRMRDAMWGAFGSSKSAACVVALNGAFAFATFVIGLGFVAFSSWDVRRAVDSLAAVSAGAVAVTAFYCVWALNQGRHEIADAVWASLDV